MKLTKNIFAALAITTALGMALPASAAVTIGGAAVDLAFLFEVVRGGGVDGGEFLQSLHASETQHRSFSSLQRLM